MYNYVKVAATYLYIEGSKYMHQHIKHCMYWYIYCILCKMDEDRFECNKHALPQYCLNEEYLS